MKCERRRHRNCDGLGHSAGRSKLPLPERLLRVCIEPFLARPTSAAPAPKTNAANESVITLLDQVPRDIWTKRWVVHCQHAGRGQKVLDLDSLGIASVIVHSTEQMLEEPFRRVEKIAGDEEVFRLTITELLDGIPVEAEQGCTWEAQDNR
jgi:hypothetical protein